LIVFAIPQSWLGAKLYLRTTPSQEAGIG
jgi:hypothetical protein